MFVDFDVFWRKEDGISSVLNRGREKTERGSHKEWIRCLNKRVTMQLKGKKKALLLGLG